jgi:hypothetical protein
MLDRRRALLAEAGYGPGFSEAVVTTLAEHGAMSRDDRDVSETTVALTRSTIFATVGHTGTRADEG